MASVNAIAQVGVARSLTWFEVAKASQFIAVRNPWAKLVYGIPRGGLPIAGFTGMTMICPQITDVPTPDYLASMYGTDELLIVDDLADSGRTLAPFVDAGFRVDALFRKSHTPSRIAPNAEEVAGWVTFPWESGAGPEDAVVRLLEWIGEDPTREGLVDTPARVVKAFREMTSGLSVCPSSVLGTVFNETSDNMVVVKGIRFSSLCEHHLLPFIGTAAVGYVPDGRVIGLSKIPRLVEVFARRPQVQERMTNQIAQALMDYLAPRGVGVVVRAHHSCMGCRGVRQPDAEMVTSCILGCMKDDPAARSELLRFV
jgi:GTP cyclohydrolase I